MTNAHLSSHAYLLLPLLLCALSVSHDEIKACDGAPPQKGSRRGTRQAANCAMFRILTSQVYGFRVINKCVAVCVWLHNRRTTKRMFNCFILYYVFLFFPFHSRMETGVIKNCAVTYSNCFIANFCLIIIIIIVLCGIRGNV